MATDTFDKYSHIHRVAHGQTTGAGEAVEVTLGFTPVMVVVYNVTDAMKWEKIAGMGATESFKTVTAGTQTADTTSAIVFMGEGDTDTYAGFALSAALAATGKDLNWIALG